MFKLPGFSHLSKIFSQQANQSKSRGFTLIELLLIVSMVVILGTMSTGFYARFLTQNAVSNTTDRLVAQLRKAQLYSMVGRANTSWGVRWQSNKITLFATGNNAFDESFDVPSNVSISGFTTVTFTRGSGVPNTTAAINISGGNNSDTLTLNSQGAVSQ